MHHASDGEENHFASLSHYNKQNGEKKIILIVI
jgi:hypothetical protein